MAAISITEVGDPGRTICDTVEKLNINLLVLGDHGIGRIKRLFFIFFLTQSVVLRRRVFV